MKNDKFWAWFAAAAVLAALSSCGSGSGNAANLRLANATLTHPSLDLLVNTSTSITGVALDTVSGYVTPGSGSDTLQVNDAGSGTALSTIVPTLAGGQHYCLVAYESAGTVQSVVLTEDFTTPVSGTAELRLYDVASNAGELDVYITDPTTVLSSVTSPTYSFTTSVVTPLLTFSPGTYRIRVTGYGNQSDLRLDMPVTVANQQVVTVLTTPASGGALLNGSVVVQQGDYTAARNTNARVRLASAVSGGATVAASATDASGTVVIDAGSVAPSFGYYVLVPGDSTLNLTVNGNSVASPATPLTVGSDATVLVYGSPTLATATLNVDNNALPVDPTTVKLSMINGLTGNIGLVTLTANTTPVGESIGPGLFSGYVSIPSSTTATVLTLSSSLVGSDFYSDATHILSANTVYTVLAAGDPTAVPSTAQVLVRLSQ